VENVDCEFVIIGDGPADLPPVFMRQIPELNIVLFEQDVIGGQIIK
jgi:hypothetical protein